CLQGDTPPYSF
nr:immunoglobulin light chain junction region [Macaca mulatta]MOW41419.1 immunoglobulin light chain junction region [Macaca mulatta]MOW42090.1 immunoglobulin light chain junction region [Macaca mulatta]MOW42168.1 immunoglobulin light chain junction region [Macaca mulatta]MOW42860.1 immunoglobulin light chain junction region [Macaca mulatta]